jgi:hypothetical protein
MILTGPTTRARARLALTDNGGSVIYAPEFIHLAYSSEPPERNYERVKLIAQAPRKGRWGEVRGR